LNERIDSDIIVVVLNGQGSGREYMAVKQTTGNCYICGAELGKTAMKNHLLKEHNEREDGQLCRLLKIEGANKYYWLYIDIPVDKTLADVDSFLREIWLECCGHMSAFRGPGRVQIGKGRKLGAFSAGDKFLHEYDFGSTTETLITIADEMYRTPQKQAVRLLARNAPPVFPCAGCGKPSESICAECSCDWDSDPYYCDSCGEEHEHEGMLMRITNSPRMGVCGYDGELDKYAFELSKISGRKKYAIRYSDIEK
jgi:hypothetical protein